MSLGSRIAPRGNPREPLFFLYLLQWIRNTSTVAATQAFGLDGNHRTFSVHRAALSKLTHNRYTTAGGSHGAVETSSDTNANESRAAVLESSYQTSNPVDGAEKDPLKKKLSLIDHEDNKERSHITIEDIRWSPIETKVRKTVQNWKKARLVAQHAWQKRQDYQEQRYEERKSRLPDWRNILADLVEHTPTPSATWLDNALNIFVPESSVKRLLCGVDDNIWDIGSRCSCLIELKSRDGTGEGYRSLLLSGLATGIAKATGEILHIAPQAKLKTNPGEILPHSIKSHYSMIEASNPDILPSRNATPRNVPADRRCRILLTTKVDEIPRPSKWTQISFNQYVQDLTSAEVPNHLHYSIYGKGAGDHTTLVTDILRAIFADAQCQSSISKAAFNMAISYFIRSNRISDARVLFVRMETIGLPMDTETFNIMLRGAAKSQDLHSFHFILRLMLKRGYSPDSRTWIAFMMTFPSTRIKLYILSAMKQKELLHHQSTMKAVCEHLVTDEIEFSLNSNQSQEEFLLRMDSRYGSSWLTVSSGNRILHRLGSRGLISRCWDFIHVMQSRFIPPNNVSINTILNHCKYSKNLEGAIEIVRGLPISMGFVPNEAAYQILFQMAWRAESVNVARVVWRYACLTAGTTWRMRWRLKKSLSYSDRNSGTGTIRQAKNRLAGLIVTGVAHFDEHPTMILPWEVGGITSGSIEGGHTPSGRSGTSTSPTTPSKHQ
jgi:pentatricopeptide repeat protein